MTVTLTVREVRDQLRSSADRQDLSGDGARSTRLLGQVFHDVFAALVTADSPMHARLVLEEIEPDLDAWRQALVKHAYRKLVGPRLDALAGQLAACPDETLQFCEAV